MGSKIVTYTGRVVDPIHPSPGDFDILDIAHALSNSCRFTGHTREFYSVAEHSVRMSLHLDELGGAVAAMSGLLHDASEAYLSDLARPIKHYSAMGAEYRVIEDRLQQAICAAFDTQWPIPEIVKVADDHLLAAEIRDLMPLTKDDNLLSYGTDSEYTHRIIPWTSCGAELRFLEQYHCLKRRR